MSRFICFDSANQKNFLIMEDGNISFYRDIDGVSRLFTPLANISTFEAASGEWFEIPGYFEKAPKVFAYPKKMKTFSGAHSHAFQRTQVSIEGPEPVTAGKFRVRITGGLDVLSGSSLIYPLDIIEERAPLSSFNYGPYFVPNVKRSVALIMGKAWEIYPNTYGYYWFYRITLSAKVGISETPSSPVSWGFPTSTTLTSTAPFEMAPVASYNGNYVWISMTKTKVGGSNNVWTPSGISPFPSSVQRIQIPCINCTCDSVSLESRPVFSCMAVGL